MGGKFDSGRNQKRPLKSGGVPAKNGDLSRMMLCYCPAKWVQTD